jgi:RNA polymerase sigma factor (sigma-70 family)
LSWNRIADSGLILSVSFGVSPPVGPGAGCSADAEVVDAFVECYRANVLWAVRLGLLLTSDVGLAEDLAQEAFLGLHRHFNDVQNRRAYLRVTLVNLANRRRRRDARRDTAHRLTAETGTVSDAANEVFDVIARLPVKQRSVIVLRYYEGLSETEIAATLGCPTGTVKSLASRALSQLRKQIEP